MTNYMSHTEIIEATQVVQEDPPLPDTLTVKTVYIHWSESNHIEDRKTFNSLKEAESALQLAARYAPDNGAYDKTKFTVTFVETPADDTYQGRIDLQRKHSREASPLKNWMVSYLEYISKTTELGDTPEDTQKILTLYRNLK